MTCPLKRCLPRRRSRPETMGTKQGRACSCQEPAWTRAVVPVGMQRGVQGCCHLQGHLPKLKYPTRAKLWLCGGVHAKDVVSAMGARLSVSPPQKVMQRHTRSGLYQFIPTANSWVRPPEAQHLGPVPEQLLVLVGIVASLRSASSSRPVVVARVAATCCKPIWPTGVPSQ